MPVAYVLINCDLGHEGEIIDKIKQIPEVIEATHVMGVYDIIVRVSSNDMFRLRKTIKLNIKNIQKIRSTLTMIVTEEPGKTTKTE
ncbi:MAG: Lrp/AsnC ligand binding domain-containing protein [Thermoproteota archaeon]|nr:Lrp/AsnC ligand binding domain-containing protein [Thermoproteota archaeon]